MAHATDVSLERELNVMFQAAKDESFEDGMRSNFSDKLMQFIDRHGVTAIELLDDMLHRPSTSYRVSAEAMRWVPRINQPETYEARRALLEKSLSHSHPFVRDGALLGLSSLDDPHAIVALQNAIQMEPNTELRADMQQLLDELEALNAK